MHFSARLEKPQSVCLPCCASCFFPCVRLWRSAVIYSRAAQQRPLHVFNKDKMRFPTAPERLASPPSSCWWPLASLLEPCCSHEAVERPFFQARCRHPPARLPGSADGLIFVRPPPAPGVRLEYFHIVAARMLGPRLRRRARGLSPLGCPRREARVSLAQLFDSRTLQFIHLSHNKVLDEAGPPLKYT